MSCDINAESSRLDRATNADDDNEKDIASRKEGEDNAETDNRDDNVEEEEDDDEDEEEHVEHSNDDEEEEEEEDVEGIKEDVLSSTATTTTTTINTWSIASRESQRCRICDRTVHTIILEDHSKYCRMHSVQRTELDHLQHTVGNIITTLERRIAVMMALMPTNATNSSNSNGNGNGNGNRDSDKDDDDGNATDSPPGKSNGNAKHGTEENAQEKEKDVAAPGEKSEKGEKGEKGSSSRGRLLKTSSLKLGSSRKHAGNLKMDTSSLPPSTESDTSSSAAATTKGAASPSSPASSGSGASLNSPLVNDEMEVTGIQSVIELARQIQDVQLNDGTDIPQMKQKFLHLNLNIHKQTHFWRSVLSQLEELFERKRALLDSMQQNMASPIYRSLMEEPWEHNRLPTIDDFEIVRTLSKGSFGEVFLARKKSTLEYFALKMLKKSDLLNRHQLDLVMNERRLMARFNSPFVIKLYYCFQSADALYMVMEYATGGDLHTFLKTVEVMTEQFARYCIAQVVLALRHVHEFGVVHRDIKPENLLITTSGQIKLTDFGLSREDVNLSAFSTKLGSAQMATGATTTTAAATVFDGPSFLTSRKHMMMMNERQKETLPGTSGTLDYLAPEVIRGTGDSNAIDWWSVGVCFYEFLIGFPPFFEPSVEGTIDNILSRDILWPESISSEARDLIDRLLQVDLLKRLGTNGAQEIMNHPFFACVDWENLTATPADESFSRYVSQHLSQPQPKEQSSPSPVARRFSQIDPERFRLFQFKNVDLLFEENKHLKTILSSSASSSSASSASSASTSSTEPSAPPVCLVAEDNVITLWVIQGMMMHLGIDAVPVSNGRDAYKKCQEMKFDVIFMDIMMPIMDGVESTQKIRQEEKSKNRDTPIIAFTALNDWEKEDYPSIGFNDMLQKPFTKAELASILLNWLPKKNILAAAGDHEREHRRDRDEQQQDAVPAPVLLAS